jgi:hypothetical protein
VEDPLAPARVQKPVENFSAPPQTGEDYDTLFHEATVQANKDYGKSFDELQKEDL